MPYIYLTVAVFMSATSTVFGQLFNRRNEGNKDTGAFYNFFLLLSVCFCWGVLFALDVSFTGNVILYAIMFAACYTVANIGIIRALRYGPTTLTSVLVGLSLVLTAVWGFVFWDAPVTVAVITGLVLVAIAVWLCLYTNKKEEKGVSWRWLFFVLLAFFGNAGCSITQRTQQMKFEGQYGNAFMLLATFLSAIACFVIYLGSDKRDTAVMMKKSWWIPACAGVCNVVLNRVVMLLVSTTLSPSLIYPVIGVGGLVVVTVFSLLVFQERMRWWQWLGVVTAMAAIWLLSM